MRFSELVEVLEKLEKISLGNEIREVLANLFKKTDKDEIDKICYLTLGQIDADYKGVVLNLAENMVVDSIKYATGSSKEEIKSVFKQTGDLGLTVQQLITNNKTSTLNSFMQVKTEKLTVQKVFDSLHKIANESGEGSQNTKVKILTNLLQSASPEEAKYIVRIVLEQLRLGVGAMSILDALSISVCGEKTQRPALEHAYNICSDIGLVAKYIAQGGLNKVLKIDVEVGKPIRMMLAKRTKTLAEIQDRIGKPIAAEEKYDGERMQIHKSGNKVSIFSRRLDNITEQYPDIVETIKKHVKGDFLVVEGEAVAIDPATKELLPFQTLMQRKRKHNIHHYVKKVPVNLFLFDLLFLNGESFLNKSYPVRRRKLESITTEKDNIKLSRQIVTENIDKLSDFFEKALENKTEGLMAKSCSDDSIYRAGARAWLWIKWKRDYMSQLNDSVDLAVVGAFAGKGKRTGKYGALLCAAYNKERDRFETVCKLGTGFSDAALAMMPEKLDKFKLDNPSPRVFCKKEMEPDFWFDPKAVVEIIGAEITKSPIHTCAIDKFKNNGLAIRFPRFIQFREKQSEESTSVEELIDML